MAVLDVARPRTVGQVRRVPRPDWPVVLALPVGAPLLYLLWLAFQATPADLLRSLARANVPELILGTAAVAVGATVWAWALAFPWAWLVARTDVPGRTLFRWLGPLPLAVPPYVGALVYALLLAPGGLLHQGLADRVGQPAGLVPFPDLMYGPWGAGLVLGIFTAPHLFLAVYAALQRTSPSLEEAARGLGLSAWAVFWRVTFPLLRPSLLAGSLVVFIYGCVDFGVVSLLRVRTFTTVIYNYLLAGFSLTSAAALSLVLLALVGGLMLLQRSALGTAQYAQKNAIRDQQRATVHLGRFRWLGFAYLTLAAFLALGLPLGTLVWQAFSLGGAALLSFFVEQAQFLVNSLLVATGGATVAVVLGSVFAWQHWSRSGGRLGLTVLQAGYAIPGTVLALSLAGLTLALLPSVYGTALVLVGAYVVLYAGPASQSLVAALAQVPRSMEEAARALGHRPLSAFARVIAPLALPGFLGAWLLTFALSMRELAATVLLRPAGFDTLSVRIWVHTMDVGPDPRAAAAALLLILVTGSAWLGLLRLIGTRDEEAFG